MSNQIGLDVKKVRNKFGSVKINTILAYQIKKENMRNQVMVYELVDLDNDNERMLTGTIEDIRTFIKNRWKAAKNLVKMTTGIEVEEDYYTHVDDTKNLFQVISDMRYQANNLCVVPIEDFMN
jgi:hypothetical protein